MVKNVHEAPRRRLRLRTALLLLAALGGVRVNAARATGATESLVWFNPAPDSPDYIDLFTHPERWAQARSRTKVFEFSPDQLQRANGLNSLAELVRADAFKQLQDWGVKTAIGMGAVKEWDCDARKTSGRMIRFIKTIQGHGGSVAFVALDEPLLSGLGLNKPICNLSINETADRTVGFVRRVEKAIRTQRLGPDPGFVETEPYPSIDLEQHKRWIDALIARGFHPVAYHLDIATAQIERRPEIRRRFVKDLRELKAFVRGRHIQFGIILWSSRDPEATDRSYFDDTISWTRTVRTTIGIPDQVLFSSWVKRCASPNLCRPIGGNCPGVEPAWCGSRSVPVNLPDDDPKIFSHTRLILSALDILGGG